MFETSPNKKRLLLVNFVYNFCGLYISLRKTINSLKKVNMVFNKLSISEKNELANMLGYDKERLSYLLESSAEYYAYQIFPNLEQQFHLLPTEIQVLVSMQLKSEKIINDYYSPESQFNLYHEMARFALINIQANINGIQEVPTNNPQITSNRNLKSAILLNFMENILVSSQFDNIKFDKHYASICWELAKLIKKFKHENQQLNLSVFEDDLKIIQNSPIKINDYLKAMFTIVSDYSPAHDCSSKLDKLKILIQSGLECITHQQNYTPHFGRSDSSQAMRLRIVGDFKSKSINSLINYKQILPKNSLCDVVLTDNNLELVNAAGKTIIKFYSEDKHCVLEIPAINNSMFSEVIDIIINLINKFYQIITCLQIKCDDYNQCKHIIDKTILQSQHRIEFDITTEKIMHTQLTDKQDMITLSPLCSNNLLIEKIQNILDLGFIPEISNEMLDIVQLLGISRSEYPSYIFKIKSNNRSIAFAQVKVCCKYGFNFTVENIIQFKQRRHIKEFLPIVAISMIDIIHRAQAIIDLGYIPEFIDPVTHSIILKQGSKSNKSIIIDFSQSDLAIEQYKVCTNHQLKTKAKNVSDRVIAKIKQNQHRVNVYFHNRNQFKNCLKQTVNLGFLVGMTEDNRALLIDDGSIKLTIDNLNFSQFKNLVELGIKLKINKNCLESIINSIARDKDVNTNIFFSEFQSNSLAIIETQIEQLEKLNSMLRSPIQYYFDFTTCQNNISELDSMGKSKVYSLLVDLAKYISKIQDVINNSNISSAGKLSLAENIILTSEVDLPTNLKQRISATRRFVTALLLCTSTNSFKQKINDAQRYQTIAKVMARKHEAEILLQRQIIAESLPKFSSLEDILKNYNGQTFSKWHPDLDLNNYNFDSKDLDS